VKNPRKRPPLYAAPARKGINAGIFFRIYDVPPYILIAFIPRVYPRLPPRRGVILETFSQISCLLFFSFFLSFFFFLSLSLSLSLSLFLSFLLASGNLIATVKGKPGLALYLRSRIGAAFRPTKKDIQFHDGALFSRSFSLLFETTVTFNCRTRDTPRADVTPVCTHP